MIAAGLLIDLACLPYGKACLLVLAYLDARCVYLHWVYVQRKKDSDTARLDAIQFYVANLRRSDPSGAIR